MHFRLCDCIFDLVQNAVEARADLVKLKLVESDTSLIVDVEDNGCGMDKLTMERALDPFYTDGIKHKVRKVGLGLPFVQQTLDSTGGTFRFESEKGKGTSLHCHFNLRHMDTPPVGDVASLFIQCLMLPGSFELIVTRSKKTQRGEDQYRLSRTELKEILGNFDQGDSIIMLRQYIRSQEDESMQGETHG